MITTAPLELTTAITDGVLAAECVVLAWWLRHSPGSSSARLRLWSRLFLLLATGSALGALAHGVVLEEGTLALLWRALYVVLALAMAFFITGAAADWRGPAAIRRVLPWSMGAALLFLFASELLAGAFVVFILYEALALAFALVVYLALSARGRLPGALVMGWGILLSLLAAWFQATDISLRLIVTFDHNALFHLVQMAAVVFLAAGVRSGGANR